ncbi:MAG: ABC transporter permease [Actinomycetaceae bacterium]|nr:ABC transporter permease [Actinomycetaceae bacterium]
MTAAPIAPAPTRKRPSPWTTYVCLLRWTAEQVGMVVPFTLVVQLLFAAGIIVGFGLLSPQITDAFIHNVACGAPTIMILMVGLVIVPQGLAQSKQNGSFTYIRSLPVARSLHLAAETTIWSAVALPAVPVAVVVARLRYDVDFSLNWPLLALTLVIATTMSSWIGYAIAVLTPAVLTQIITQVLVFFVLLFSPIAFPASQLPEWMRTLHEYLPFESVVELMRASLLSQHFTADARDFLVIGVWAAVGLAVSLRGLARRG